MKTNLRAVVKGFPPCHPRRDARGAHVGRWAMVCALGFCRCGLLTSIPIAAQEPRTVFSFTNGYAVQTQIEPRVALLPSPVAVIRPSCAGLEGGGTGAPEESTPIPKDILAKIPRRVFSAGGSAGDVVNFIIVGTKQDMKKAMDAAGWDTVARTKMGALWRDLFESLYIKSYRGIPMTKLYLFGRPQDFGYAHSRGLLSVRNRHHFRIWRAPFQMNGQTLWIGAATHDVALQFQGHFLHVVHKIDPDVDAERQYVSNTLTRAGRAEVLGYIDVPDAPTRARTANGEDFYTDGRTLVLQLVSGSKARSAPNHRQLETQPVGPNP